MQGILRAAELPKSARDRPVHKGFFEGAEYGLYFRLRKIPCGFKDQAKARQSGKKCGLALYTLNDLLWLEGRWKSMPYHACREFYHKDTETTAETHSL